MDPITTAIVAALSAGASGMPPEAGKLIIKDAYEELKAAIKRKFGNESKLAKSVSALEDEPDFKPNQDALAGRIEQVKAAADSELLQLARELTAALQKTAEGRKTLAKYNVKIQNSEVGVIGDNAHVEGGKHFGKK